MADILLKRAIKIIPDDWERVKIGDIGTTFGGLTNKSKKDFGEGKPFIPFMNIMNNAKIDMDDFDYVNARKLFNNPFDFEDIKVHFNDLKMNKPDKNELLKFLENTKLHKKYFDEIDKNLMNYYLNIDIARSFDKQEKKQEKITNYFSTSI